MKHEVKVHILGTTKKCLLYLGLTSERHVPIGSARVPRTLIRCLIIGSQSVFVAISVIGVMQEWERGLYAIIYPLHLLLVVSSKLCIYTVFSIQTDRIAGLIGYLQDVVDERK